MTDQVSKSEVVRPGVPSFVFIYVTPEMPMYKQNPKGKLSLSAEIFYLRNSHSYRKYYRLCDTR